MFSLSLELSEETRLSRQHKISKEDTGKDENFPLLTDLFFVAHTALRLAFPTLLALHMETNRQLNQWEQEAVMRSSNGDASAFLAGSFFGGTSADPEGVFIIFICFISFLTVILFGLSDQVNVVI